MAGDGVTKMGTESSDTKCGSCPEGQTSPSESSTAECFDMSDMDQDGLWDRITPGWEPGMDFDRGETPLGGGEFDLCPFDPENDSDGDGICGGVPPLHVWHDHLNEFAGEYYAAGGPRVDQCSNDPDNNKDKDRKCDERGTDDQVVSWDFYTHPLNDKGKKAGLVGWSDKEDVFEVAGEEPVVLSELDDRRFIFDERVIEICERSDSAIDALFSVTRGRYDWTGTMESVQHLIEVRDAAQLAVEEETDELYKETLAEFVIAADEALAKERKTVVDKAYILKNEMHEIEQSIEGFTRRMSNTERLREGAQSMEERDNLDKKLTEIGNQIKGAQEKIKTIKQDPHLPPSIAEMKMENFKFPTCQALCSDHNMKCLEGKLVSSTNELSMSANEMAQDEITEQLKVIEKLMKKREDYEMYYEQARVKSEMIMDPKARAEHVTTKRVGELKGDLLQLQKDMESAEKKKKELESKLSSCEPFAADADEARNKRRAEQLEERIAGFQETLDYLGQQKATADAAIGAANDDSEKRDAYTLAALIDAEIEETTAEKEEMMNAKTGCMDEEKDASIFLQCKCEMDPEPLQAEEWSMSNVCTTCYAQSKGKKTGIIGVVFPIKKNTFRFAMQGASSMANFAKLTILDKDFAGVAGKMPGARNLDGRPNFQETVSNDAGVDEDGNETDPHWYPVEWDVSEFIGRDALIQIARMDENKSMKIDEFEFFNDDTGCLPTCMAIRDGVCNGGETCFYFEKDLVPYVETKSTGYSSGTYCRASNGGGSPLGPGISNMGYDFADWTDGHADVLAEIAVYDALVMEHDSVKAEFLKKEKAKGHNDHEEDADGDADGWMMESDKIHAKIQEIDNMYEEKLYKQKLKIQEVREALYQRISTMEVHRNGLRVEMRAAIITEAEAWGEKKRIDSTEAAIEKDDPNWKEAYNTVIIAQEAEQDRLKDLLTAAQVEINELRGGDAGWAGATLDYLSIRRLPRCIDIDMRGSHYAIKVTGQSSATLWAYEPEPTLDNAKTSAQSVYGTHCVFNSIKPRCLSVSKGDGQFTKDMHANCKEEIFEGTCYNQCARFFCSEAYDKDGNGSADSSDKDACGKDDADSPGAYDRCANCCGRLSENDGWSSCLTRRRRRRLREAVTTFDNEGSEDHRYSRHECAESCLQTDGCIAFDTREGACIISKECDHAAGEGGGFRTGKWYVKKISDPTLTQTELDEAYALQLGRDADYGKPKKRRVRKDKAATYTNTLKEDQDEIAQQMQDVRDNVDMTAEEQQAALEELEKTRTEQLGADADGSRLAGNGENGAEVVV
jgi:hypothetical protein